MDCDIAREYDNFTASQGSGAGAKREAMHTECRDEAAACLKEGGQAFERLASVDGYTLRTYKARHRSASTSCIIKASAEKTVKPTEYMEGHAHTSRTALVESPNVWVSDMNYRVAVKQQLRSGATSLAYVRLSEGY